MTEKKKLESFNAQMSPGFGSKTNDNFLDEEAEKIDEIVDEQELLRLK
jgi:hypothetical protein